jgi:DnaK suppressor protein
MAELEAVRQRLQARDQVLAERLRQATDQTSAVEPDRAIGRLTRLDAVQQGHMNEELRRQAVAERSRIARALARIDDGTYGVCPRCEEPIADARLDAQPDAVLCVGCASARR